MFKTLLLLFCLSISSLALSAQQFIYLGSELSGQQSTGGCSASCAGTPLDPANGIVCSTSGTGTHSTTTDIAVITVPAVGSIRSLVATNNCGRFSGLDSDDALIINGIQYPVSGNSIIGFTECFDNSTSSQAFDYEVEYKPGSENISDLLSRLSANKDSVHCKTNIADRYIRLIAFEAVPDAMTFSQIQVISCML